MASALRICLRLAARYPLVTIVVLVITAFTIVLKKNVADDVAYQNSPAGKAEAARREQASEDAMDLDLAQSFVKNRLRDPDSAQFAGLQVVRRSGEKGVCGSVNSRNGFGAKAGNEAFAAFGTDVIMANDANQKDLKRLDKLCYGR